MKHFKHVAKGPAQLIFGVGEGHGPAFTALMGFLPAAAADSNRYLVQAMKHGLRGQPIDSELLMNMSGPIRFVKGSKLRSKIPAR